MTNQIALSKKTISEVENKVNGFVEKRQLDLPSGYSASNAFRSAQLVLNDIKDRSGKPALEVVTPSSLANALLSMVVQGLNPQKSQGYFIVYGKTLVFQRSYFGTMAVTKRITGAKEINAFVIYEGDDVTYEVKNGKITNLSHKQKFGASKNKIIGAYCVIVMPDETENYTELMTIDDIHKAWNMGQTKGKSKAHENFEGEMAKKTVINRACKGFVNSSNDSTILTEYFNKSDDAINESRVQDEVDENANSEVFDAEYEEVEHNHEEPQRPDNVNEDGEIIGQDEFDLSNEEATIVGKEDDPF